MDERDGCKQRTKKGLLFAKVNLQVTESAECDVVVLPIGHCGGVFEEYERKGEEGLHLDVRVPWIQVLPPYAAPEDPAFYLPEEPHHHLPQHEPVVQLRQASGLASPPFLGGRPVRWIDGSAPRV